MHNVPTATEVSSETCAGARQGSRHQSQAGCNNELQWDNYPTLGYSVDTVDNQLLQTGDNSYSPSPTSCSVAVSSSGELYIIHPLTVAVSLSIPGPPAHQIASGVSCKP